MPAGATAEAPAAQGPAAGTRRAAVTGARRLLGTRAGTKALSLSATFVLARLLAPADFGLFAGAAGLVAILGQVVQLDLRRDLVRLDRGRPERARAYLHAQALMGLALALVIYASAGPLAGAAGHAAAAPLLRLLALWPLLEALRPAPAALLEVAGRFGALAVIEWAGVVAQVAFALALAGLGFGPFALAWGFLAASLARLLAAWLQGGRALLAARPAPADYASLARVGLPLFAAGLCTTFYWRIDDVLVLAGLGAGAAGLYALAFQVPHALLQLGEVLGRVSLGVLGRRSDLAARRRVFSAGVRASQALLWPAFCVGAVQAGDLLALLFGPAWRPAAGAFAVFLALVALRGASSPWADVATLESRFDLVVKASAAVAVLTPVGVVVGLRLFGLLGAAIGVLAAWAVPAPCYLGWTARRLGIEWGPLVLPALAAAAASLAAGCGALSLLEAPGLSLRAATAAGQLAVFYAVLLAVDRDLRGLAADLLRGRTG